MAHFYLLTALWDGRVLRDEWISEPPSPLEKALMGPIVADGSCRAELETRIGHLSIDWNAEPRLGIGTATLWRGEKLAMTMVYMAERSPEALDLARLFTQGWEAAEYVKAETRGEPIFTSALESLPLPFGLALNWATISAEDLKTLGEPDVAIGAAFFANLANHAKHDGE